MSAQEPYDYLSTVTPDTDLSLSIVAQGSVKENSRQNVVIHEGDDESEERIILSSTPVFSCDFQWNQLSESDAGSVLDLYHSANGMGKSFKWIHDGHMYVARFDCEMNRSGPAPSRYGSSVKLKLLGKVTNYALNLNGTNEYLDAVSLGAEIITNGAFASDLSDWDLTVGSGGGSITWSAGTLLFTQGGVSKGMYASQDIATTIGSMYKVTVTVATSGGPSTRVAVGTTQNGNQIYLGEYGGARSITVYFVATSATTWINLVDANSPTLTSTWDNVVVKEVTIVPKAFSCWVYPGAAGTSGGYTYHQIITKHTAYSFGLLFDYDLTPNRIYIFFEDSLGNLSSAYYSITNYTAWYHIVGQFESDNKAHLYVNGVDQTPGSAISDAMGYNNTMAGAAVQIGGGLTGRYSSCIVDECRIYDQPLTAAQISAMYADPKYGPTGNLLAYWSFNRISDDLASGIRDESGNGNSGTVYNIDSSNFVAGKEW